MAPCKRMRCTMCLRIGVVAEGLTAERLGGKRAATCKTCKDMQRWTMRGWSAHANPLITRSRPVLPVQRPGQFFVRCFTHEAHVDAVTPSSRYPLVHGSPKPHSRRIWQSTLHRRPADSFILFVSCNCG